MKLTVLSFFNFNNCLGGCLLLFVFLITVSENQTIAQCPDREIILSTQKQIDDFVQKYPNCTKIKSDLFIGGLDIQDLSGLVQIQSIQGAMSIGFGVLEGPAFVRISRP